MTDDRRRGDPALEEYRRELEVLRRDIADLSDVVHGNERRTIEGIVKKMVRLEQRGVELEDYYEQIQKDNEARKNVMNGIKVGLGLTGAGTALNMLLQVVLQ